MALPAVDGRLRTLVRAGRLVLRAGGRSVWSVVAVQLLGGFIGGATIWSAGQVISGLTGDEPDWDATWPWIAVLAALTTLAGLLTAVGSEQQRLIAELVQRSTVERVLDSAATVPYERFDLGGFYDRMRRAIEGASGSATGIVWGTLGATRTLIDAVFILVVLAAVAPVVIPIAAAAYVPLFFASRLSNRRSHRFLWNQTPGDRRRTYLASVFGDRNNGREVRMFDLGATLGKWHHDLWTVRLDALRRLVRARIGFAAIGSLLSSSMTALALGLVAWLAARGDLELADAGVGILGVHRLAGASTRLNSHLAMLDRGGREMRDYDRFLAEAEAERERLVGPAPPDRVDEVSLHGVTFRYPGAERDALTNVSTTLRRGEVTAVVGPNGSGKSTLMMLLCNLYSPTAGSIKWNGRDIAEFHPSLFRNAVAPMFQDFTRYQLAARDNVTLSDAAARDDDERIHEVLDTVGARDLVSQLRHGIDTELSRAWDDGTELSAGQWQRLAAARALFRSAPLLILDEPSADLDAMAEQVLVDELIAACDARCVVFISHRFSAIRKADRIVVLEHGHLVEDGSHDDLMRLGGLYASMYRTQTGLEV